jgi:nitrite reductase/ring-hydroxylating ferredoxin subunit
MPWTKLAALKDLPPGELIEVEHNSSLYALCNVDGDIRAVSGLCPHEGGPLGEGVLNGDFIGCPWHMWEFDSKTGACSFGEACAIPTFPVKIEGHNILVDIA